MSSTRPCRPTSPPPPSPTTRTSSPTPPGQGQTAGSAPGDLPPGYLPLTSTLQTQAQSVVTQLQALAGGTASPTASPTASATGTTSGETTGGQHDDRREHDDRRDTTTGGTHHDRREHDHRREHHDRRDDDHRRDDERREHARPAGPATDRRDRDPVGGHRNLHPGRGRESASPSTTAAATAAPASTACASAAPHGLRRPPALGAGGRRDDAGHHRGLGPGRSHHRADHRRRRRPRRLPAPLRPHARTRPLPRTARRPMTRDRPPHRCGGFASTTESRPQRLGRRIVGSPAKEHPALPLQTAGYTWASPSGYVLRQGEGKTSMRFKPPTMLRKHKVRSLLAAGSCSWRSAALAFAQAAPAKADPQTTLVAVGSDTIQDVWNAFTRRPRPSGRVPRAARSRPGRSYNATNPATGAINEIITPTDGWAVQNGIVPNPTAATRWPPATAASPARTAPARASARWGSRSTRQPIRRQGPAPAGRAALTSPARPAGGHRRQQHRPSTSSASRSRSTLLPAPPARPAARRRPTARLHRRPRQRHHRARHHDGGDPALPPRSRLHQGRPTRCTTAARSPRAASRSGRRVRRPLSRPVPQPIDLYVPQLGSGTEKFWEEHRG